MMELSQHLPVLQVVVPLIVAPLIVLFRNKNIAWLLATLTAFFCLYTSVELLMTVRESGAIDYKIGNWERHVGIVYHIDVANAYILTIVSAVSVFVFPYSYHSIQQEIPEYKLHYFYSAWSYV